MSLFDQSLVRFATSGTLILFYSLVDHAARRSRPQPEHARQPHPRWLGLVFLLSITAFYLCIKPLGGAMWSGLGNALGIACCGAAMAWRWVARRGLRSIRMPEVAARMAFYAALPLAVGVPLGWLTLSVPAIVCSAIVCARQDRWMLARSGAPYAARMAQSARWVPGVF